MDDGTSGNRLVPAEITPELRVVALMQDMLRFCCWGPPQSRPVLDAKTVCISLKLAAAVLMLL